MTLVEDALEDWWRNAKAAAGADAPEPTAPCIGSDQPALVFHAKLGTRMNAVADNTAVYVCPACKSEFHSLSLTQKAVDFVDAEGQRWYEIVVYPRHTKAGVRIPG